MTIALVRRSLKAAPEARLRWEPGLIASRDPDSRKFEYGRSSGRVTRTNPSP